MKRFVPRFFPIVDPLSHYEFSLDAYGEPKLSAMGIHWLSLGMILLGRSRLGE